MNELNVLPGFSVECDAVLGPLRLRVRETVTANWTVLFGASGSGKSTLLRVLAGLWRPANTTVLVNGEDVSRTPAHKRGIVLAAQQPALFPNRTVFGNISFGYKDSMAGDAWFDELVDAFEVRPLLGKYPLSLSGGEQQRTALARAIAARPRLLLLDESFTGMHRAQQARLVETVRSYCATLRTQVLSVTHDVAEAFSGDEVLRIENGAIVARGRPGMVLAEEREALLKRLDASAIQRRSS